MKTLADLEINEIGYVEKIIGTDEKRKHFLALGFITGTKVKTTLISNGGNPKAYQIRGITIAIRNQDAKNIILKN